VSLALLAKGVLDMPTTAIYIISQVIGALLAVMWWRFTLGAKKH
jgi:glycerol uptake facilitator-like aquaporin